MGYRGRRLRKPDDNIRELRIELSTAATVSHPHAYHAYVEPPDPLGRNWPCMF